MNVCVMVGEQNMPGSSGGASGQVLMVKVVFCFVCLFVCFNLDFLCKY